MGWRVGLAKDAPPRLLRALVRKQGSSPTYLFHVIARGSSDNEINKYTSTTTFALLAQDVLSSD
jgi:hypothetical protein